MRGESSAYFSEAPAVMTKSSREVIGAEAVMAESSLEMRGVMPIMVESSGEVIGAESIKEEPSCPDMYHSLEQIDQDGHYSDGKEKKEMEKNGGLRPGRKWPQYLAANLGTRLYIYHTYVQVPDHIQEFIT
jgi:hypothetical protein